MRRCIVIIAVMALALAGLTGCSGKLNDVQKAIKERHPEYFDLDASNGLDVIVWQMAENSYSFALLEHSEKERDPYSEEMLNLSLTDARGLSAGEIKSVLEIYNVDEDDIYIIPLVNSVSSYFPPSLMDNEDAYSYPAKESKEEYIKKIHDMIF